MTSRPLPSTLFAALLLLSACPSSHEPATKSTAPPPAQKRPEEMPSSSDDSVERTSLATLANGAVLIDRTGESYLELSALNLIDGNPDSLWLAPPHDMPQSVVVELATRTRVTSIGFRSVAKGDFHLRDARVEAMTANGAFATIATVKLTDSHDAQWFDVPPTEADRLRVTFLSGPTPGHEVSVNSFLVHGQELAPPAPRQLTGTWKLNGHDAAFAQFGNHISGVIQYNKLPVYVEGGVSNNRLLRLLWIRGLEHGLGVATVSRDGKHFGMIEWHEEPIPLFYDDAWFGERVSETPAPDTTEVFAASYMHRAKRWPLFGLTFAPDGTLDTAASDHALQVLGHMIAKAPAALRLVSHELREATPAANRTRAQRALDTLHAELAKRGANLANVQFVAAGSDNPRQLPATQNMRELYSSVDLEILR